MTGQIQLSRAGPLFSIEPSARHALSSQLSRFPRSSMFKPFKLQISILNSEKTVPKSKSLLLLPTEVLSRIYHFLDLAPSIPAGRISSITNPPPFEKCRGHYYSNSPCRNCPLSLKSHALLQVCGTLRTDYAKWLRVYCTAKIYLYDAGCWNYKKNISVDQMRTLRNLAISTTHPSNELTGEWDGEKWSKLLDLAVRQHTCMIMEDEHVCSWSCSPLNTLRTLSIHSDLAHEFILLPQTTVTFSTPQSMWTIQLTQHMPKVSHLQLTVQSNSKANRKIDWRKEPADNETCYTFESDEPANESRYSLQHGRLSKIRPLSVQTLR
ncbi:hypothetical protein EJ08DRAFT_142001 [Tothia fuscella]|uniref:Uncharacterized protein n=1 Tax=Tothia fuscella TaxID=1048955 RepID=A0A9P4NU72_9PEZI|nr:hypothetical protein EJ08DRAFT_142001 [Tothia fuscella]